MFCNELPLVFSTQAFQLPGDAVSSLCCCAGPAGPPWWSSPPPSAACCRPLASPGTVPASMSPPPVLSLSALTPVVFSAPYMSSSMSLSTGPVCSCWCISGCPAASPGCAMCASAPLSAPPPPSRYHRISALPLGLGAFPRAWSHALVALFISLRSLVMRLKEDMVDGPRLVPPVTQWAARAILERAEAGLLGSSMSLDIFFCGWIFGLFYSYRRVGVCASVVPLRPL